MIRSSKNNRAHKTVVVKKLLLKLSFIGDNRKTQHVPYYNSYTIQINVEMAWKVGRFI